MDNASKHPRVADARLVAVARARSALEKMAAANGMIGAARAVARRLRALGAESEAAIGRGHYLPGRESEARRRAGRSEVTASAFTVGEAGAAEYRQALSRLREVGNGREETAARRGHAVASGSLRAARTNRYAHSDSITEGDEFGGLIARSLAGTHRITPIVELRPAPGVRGRHRGGDARTGGGIASALAGIAGRRWQGALARAVSADAGFGTPVALRRGLAGGLPEVSRRGGERLRALAPAEFGGPRAVAASSGSGATRAMSVAVQSSPTVVIQRGGLASDELERRVIDALRTHREQLYAELEHEFARRRRMDFERA